MTTEALELALALHQAPIQRFALRDRPLPKDIGVALQLASSAQPQLQEAAARFSESEETIVEAVRFYLQQVLFEPGTDAYRILGLAADAEFKQIREHHIWLQRWLHPDRRGEDWEAALATKVNWAWQQLRSEASREAYDSSRQSGVARNSADSAGVEPVQVPLWNAAPIEPVHHWMRRLAMAAVLVACVGLFYLAATRQDRVDPDALALQSRDANSAIRPRLPFEADVTDRPQPSPTPAVVAIPRAAPAQNDEPVSAIPAVDKERVSPAIPSASYGSRVVDADVEPVVVVSSAGALAVEADRVGETASMPVEPNGITRAPAPIAKNVQPAEAETAAVASAPAQQLPADRELTIAQAPARGMPRADHRDLAVAPQPGEEPRKSTRRELPAPVESANSTQKSTVVASVADKRTVKRVAPVTAPPPAVEIEPPATKQPSQAADTAIVANEAPPPQQTASTLSAPELDRETLARFEQARDRLRSMISYFRSADGAAPDWNDELGRDAAALERERLHGRNAELGVERFALDPPVWQITHTAVGLKANYHVDAKLASAESGRFLLDMVWQDGSWKITRIEVSPRR